MPVNFQVHFVYKNSNRLTVENHQVMNRTLWKAQFFLTPEQPEDHHGQLLLIEQNFLIYSYILGGNHLTQLA